MSNLNAIKDLIVLINSAIKDEPNNLITGGGIIKSGYDKQVDEIRDILENSRIWLENYQNKLIEETGAAKLKIKFTNVFGYFIELPLSAKDSVPDYFVHKQTLVNAIRFITPELKDFEQKLIEGEGKLAQREYEIYEEVRKDILSKFSEVKTLSEKIAKLDMMASLSQNAYDNNYCKPEVTKKTDLEILSGRHPIVEQIENDFISNDLSLDKKKHIHIITGPNMGGKSTFLRQNALIILMSHIGSYVPARSAKIPLTDKIFSRVGASDNLFLGQSTFMVEMQEMANILHNYTQKSFIIIDEIGRGTSTYDGMSIAWSILETLHNKNSVKTLFATHYHELVDESQKLKHVDNYSVAVGENDDGIVFLRKVIKGAIKKSYGLEVAKLSGIPKEVISGAKQMLQKLEAQEVGGGQLNLGSLVNPIEKVEVKIVEKIVEKQGGKDGELEQELSGIDVDNLTPLEALNVLNKLKNKI
ncbi:MAG: DNA mismatch repair protein MutS [Candidatus Gracilibacteria bacterium]|nr:DNA mismatch repair protein MutS [Candidatus Gracilibacteria bacterium]